MRILFLFSFIFLINNCTGMKPEEYKNTKPEIKIEEYFMKDHKYDLKGAIFHNGDNNNFGHYTTLLKNNGDNWVGISDSIVLNNLDIYMPFFNKNGKSVKNYRQKLLFYYFELF